ncbi:MAG: hypothetical protein E6J41_26575, partial [Chloroflexi bacterium]
PTGERRWSTPDILAVEERLVAGALGRRDEGTAIVPDDVLRDSLTSSLRFLPTLGADQLEMVARLASSGAGVECVEAAPGTGKTTALGVYVAACRAGGISVVGCAPSARARDELRLGAHVDRCYTVDKLLLELRRSSLEPGSVVILDEASMAGSRKLERLLAMAEASGTKVVLVGDTKQLSSVDAGGGFRGLVARLGAHVLLENRRQVQPWEREALRNLRDGRVRQAMTAYAAHNRLHMGEHGDLLDRMVDDWWAARPQGEAVMQASRWADVLALNERARERMVGARLVEAEGLDVRGQTIGVGDQVMVLRNAPTLGVINGTWGTITDVDRERGDLVMRTAEAEPRTVRLPASFWSAKGRRRVVLAYCRTIHKAQGSTYRGSSFTLAGDDTIHFEATHVALSRATVANHLYYSGEPQPDEDHHSPEIAAPAFDGLVAAVERSRAQVMALDLLAGQIGAHGGAAPSVGAAGQGIRLAELPMTEKQVAVLARRDALPDRDLTWVQASLLIDTALGTPRGTQATKWLREKGVSRENAANIIERAEQELRTPSQDAGSEAVEARLETLEAAAPRSSGARSELAVLRRQGADSAADRMRRRRLAWAQQSRPADAPRAAAPENPSRKIAR